MSLKINFNDDEIKYLLLKRILDFIDDDDEDLSTEEIKEELREYGLNLEESIQKIKDMIKEAMND